MHQAWPSNMGWRSIWKSRRPLWWEELETMIAAEARARHATEVGFNFITEPARQALKTRLFGR